MLKFSGWSCLISGRRVEVARRIAAKEGDRSCLVAERTIGCDLDSGRDERRQRHAALSHLPCWRPLDPGRAAGPALQPTRSLPVRGKRDGHVRPGTSPPVKGKGWARGEPTLRQACSRPKSRAQYAFKDSMIHGILQFTLRIAFRCVLHRCGSQDIRC
jgi:hypothetical protein